MIKARCVRACTWNGRYWNSGEMYEGAEKPPRHFEVLTPLLTEEPEPVKPEEQEEEKPKKTRSRKKGE